jgi:hypothetical protein
LEAEPFRQAGPGPGRGVSRVHDGLAQIASKIRPVDRCQSQPKSGR